MRLYTSKAVCLINGANSVDFVVFHVITQRAKHVACILRDWHRRLRLNTWSEATHVFTLLMIGAR